VTNEAAALISGRGKDRSAIENVIRPRVDVLAAPLDKRIDVRVDPGQDLRRKAIENAVVARRDFGGSPDGNSALLIVRVGREADLIAAREHFPARGTVVNPPGRGDFCPFSPRPLSAPSAAGSKLAAIQVTQKRYPHPPRENRNHRCRLQPDEVSSAPCPNSPSARRDSAKNSSSWATAQRLTDGLAIREPITMRIAMRGA
jgi:hypothetical protein